jgi:hypothetical protein
MRQQMNFSMRESEPAGMNALIGFGMVGDERGGRKLLR